MKEEVLDHGLQEVIRLIKSKYGCSFEGYAISSLTRRLDRIRQLLAIPTHEEFLMKIDEGILSKEFLLDEISVNVTELFRDPEVWVSYKKYLENFIPSTKKLIVCHHGCSTGEEVFSNLILLKELKLDDHVEIFAYDMNPRVIEKARVGKFSARLWPLYEENFKKVLPGIDFSKYFLFEKDFVCFSNKLLSKVKFEVFTLGQESPPARADILFCRNVMIYFDQTLQHQVITLLSEQLSKNGLLLIGKNESLILSDYVNQFKILNFEAKMYQKG